MARQTSRTKDNNFRGETISNNTLYITKGSGGNGINTVYQVGASGVLPTPASAATNDHSRYPAFLPSLPTPKRHRLAGFGAVRRRRRASFQICRAAL